jgi:eukaryotic-like serine/threonine-protein kinase
VNDGTQSRLTAAGERPALAASDFPERIGRYELLVSIGSGGMARVFLARASGAEGFEREVALKLLHPHLREIPEFTTGLLDEARIAAGVHHPNVVQILDVVEDEVGVYLVMEYVEGDTLAGLVRGARARGERLPPAIAVRVLADALAGLHAAHELKDRSRQLVGLVHRDFSPQNILAGIDGTSRLTDFGVVKAAGRIGHTKTGLVKGKVRYMSPEQARARPIDRRADVWAAGVVAWELFADQPLHPPDEDDAATLLRVVSEPPARLRSVWPGAPPALEEAVASALTMDPTKRCPSAEELRKRLLAAWSSVGDVADSTDLGEYVARATEQRRERRRGLVEMIRARRKAAGEAPAPLHPIVPIAPALSSEPSSEPLTEAATVTTPRSIPAPQVPAPGGRSRTAVPVLAAAGLLALGALGFMLGTRSEPAQPAPGGSALPAASAERPAQPPAPSVEPPALRNNQIRVIADRPISRLRIGNRLIALAPAERDVTIRLTDSELEKDERIEAVAKDGRKMMLTVDGTADIIDIDFSSAQQKPRRAALPPAGATAKPSTGRAPLAPNPYGKRP